MGEQSVSRQLTKAIVSRLTQAIPALDLVYRDLAASPIPSHSPALFALRVATSRGGEGAANALSKASASTKDDLATVNAALDDFLLADIVVIGAPMYNLSIPSQLKAWIDGISVAGKTFRYTPTGSIGLCKAKRVILASSRGGIYTAPSPAAAFDYQETYLKGFFTFIGIEDLSIIRAEGVSIDAEHRKNAMESAMAQISAL